MTTMQPAVDDLQTPPAGAVSGAAGAATIAAGPLTARLVVGSGLVLGSIAFGLQSLGVLPPESLFGLWLGIGVSLAVGAVGLYVLARCATVDDPDPHKVSRLYLTGIGVSFGLQAVGAFALVVAFSLSGEKFASVAALGLSFAAAAMLLQCSGAVAISRFLQARARRREASGTANPSPQAPH